MSDLPGFEHRAYGIELTYLGEDGGIVAHGHVPPLRFLAAANHMAREVFAVVNIWDDRSTRVADAVDAVEHRWAVSDPAMASAEGCDWWIRLDREMTAGTPGVFPVTYLPESL